MLNKKIKALLYASNLWYFGEGMLGPLFAVFTAKIGGNILDITWAWATYLIVAGVLVMVVGQISDRFSKEKIMLIGYGLNTVFTFSYLLVSAPLHLFIVQAGLGVAAALAIPTWSALYDVHYENKRHEGLVWGLADGQAKIATGLAIIIGGLIVNFFSFKLLFVLMGLIQLLATVYQAQILKK